MEIFYKLRKEIYYIMNSIYNLSNSIKEDLSEFEESISLSEADYNKIKMQAIQEEYSYLNEGIASKLLNSIKGFFTKMSLWIKNRYRDLKNFSNKTLVKMKKVFGLISKFALENEDRIIEGAKTGEAVVTIRNWYPELLDIDKLEKELDSLKFSDEFESIMNDTQKFVDDHFKSNDLVEVKITQKMAKIAIKNAINSDKVDSLIKKYVKEAEEALRKTEEASKEGLKNTKDEQKVIESKEQVDESKKDILKTSKKCSILINLINKAVIDSHKINVACASMYTGNNN
jgi:hypothetical protein